MHLLEVELLVGEPEVEEEAKSEEVGDTDEVVGGVINTQMAFGLWSTAGGMLDKSLGILFRRILFRILFRI